MSKEFQHSRVYPLKPRIWLWFLTAAIVGGVIGLGLWAFLATTGGN